MAYLGTVPAEAYSPTAVKDSFNGDGSTVAFTMSQPSKTNDVRVVVENVIQDPTVAYSCSGTTITFTSAPPVGTANVYVVHLGLPVQSIVPPDEINIATTYTTDLTVEGAFTSVGIDDNADATAITIDSSENVLVGKTATGYNTAAGTELWSNGFSAFTRDDATVSYFNRKTSDGTITSYLKDGTEVGAISSVNGASIIVYGDTGIRFGGDGYLPVDSSGSLTDNAVDFGNGSWRYKDLYLSGGVYLGGTGSANYLDDYEEGTWTPVINGGFTISGVSSAIYTKVGRAVHIQADFTITGTGTSATLQITGLPFTNISSGWASGSGYFQYVNSNPYHPPTPLVNASSTLLSWQYNASTSQGGGMPASNVDSGYVNINVTYQTS